MDSQEQNYKFISGIVDEDCSIVDQMISSGYIPTKANIRVACTVGNVDIVTRLLSCGADIDVQEGFITAVLYEKYHLLDHLFLAGANVNYVDNHSLTPLHYAKCPEICKWLLDMGAYQVKGSRGQTPLYNACCKDNLPIVKLLLQHNSRSSSSNSNSSLNNLTCSEILEFDDDGNSCLSQACCYGSIEIVKLLLQYKEGIDIIDHANNYGDTCLHEACVRNNDEMVKLLLQYKQGMSIINKPGKYKETPLIVACRYNNFRTIEILLQHLCNFSYPNVDSSNFSHPNEISKTNEFVQCILNIVEAINTTNNNGQTALHHASKSGSYTSTRLITLALKELEQKLEQSLEQSVPLNLVQAASLIKDKRGCTPMDLAYHDGIRNLLKR